MNFCYGGDVARRFDAFGVRCRDARPRAPAHDERRGEMARDDICRVLQCADGELKDIPPDDAQVTAIYAMAAIANEIAALMQRRRAQYYFAIFYLSQSFLSTKRA